MFNKTAKQFDKKNRWTLRRLALGFFWNISFVGTRFGLQFSWIISENVLLNCSHDRSNGCVFSLLQRQQITFLVFNGFALLLNSSYLEYCGGLARKSSNSLFENKSGLCSFTRPKALFISERLIMCSPESATLDWQIQQRRFLDILTPKTTFQNYQQSTTKPTKTPTPQIGLNMRQALARRLCAKTQRFHLWNICPL